MESFTSVPRLYAGIGSRTTPEDVLHRMERLAELLSRYGWCLRSGGAKGADTAFEHGAGSGHKEIFLPSDHIPMWCHVFVEKFHPNPGALRRKGDNAWRLMCRNSMQILGRDGDTPVEFVVGYTANGKGAGGTGQAYRIAEYFDIPVYDFYNEQDIVELKKFLRRQHDRG